LEILPQSNVSLVISMEMVGRSYLIVDQSAGHESKYGQIIVSGRDIFVKVAAPTVQLQIQPGSRVIFDCEDCSTNRPAWIAPTNAAGEIAASSTLPFVFGVNARFYAMHFESNQRFYYLAPPLENVSGVITVGIPTNASDLLPYRGMDLTCRCNFPECHPSAPCQNDTAPTPPPSYLPPIPTIPPANLCPGLTSAKCPTVQGIEGVVWGVSESGKDCGNFVGSVAQPFRSIGKAVCAASDGDVVLIEMTTGVFREDMEKWGKEQKLCDFPFLFIFYL
jgi:hypothetical protein